VEIEREKRFGSGSGNGVYGDNNSISRMYALFRELFSKEEEKRKKLEDLKKENEAKEKSKEKVQRKKRFRRGVELIDEEDLEDDEYSRLYEGEDEQLLHETGSIQLQLSRRIVEEAFVRNGFSLDDFQTFITEFRNLNVLSLSSNGEVITLLD
jgi:hypothetical protein